MLSLERITDYFIKHTAVFTTHCIFSTHYYLPFVKWGVYCGTIFICFVFRVARISCNFYYLVQYKPYELALLGQRGLPFVLPKNCLIACRVIKHWHYFTYQDPWMSKYFIHTFHSRHAKQVWSFPIRPLILHSSYSRVCFSNSRAHVNL